MTGTVVQAADTRPQAQVGPVGIEWWLGYTALIAPALLLLRWKMQGDTTDSSLPAQIVWSTAYFFAAKRLLADGDRFRALLSGSRTLWLFVFFMLLSTVWSVAPSDTLKESIELIGTTVIACYFVVRYPLPRLLELVGFAYGTIAALSAMVIVISPGRGRMDWGSGAWCGVYQDKNNLGAAMAMTVIVLTVLLLIGSGRRNFVTLLTLLLAFALLLGSKSGTALNAGIVAVVLGTAALLFRSARCGFLARILAAVLGALGAVWFSFAGFNHDAVFEALGRTSTLTGRTDFWPYLIQAIGDRPLLGYGYKAFFGSPEAIDYLSNYVVQAGGWAPYHAHNTFLQVCLDAGFLGLAMLVVLLLIAFLRSVRYLATERGASAAWPLMVILYIVGGSYTETYLANYNSVEWLFFVAALLYPARAVAYARTNASNSPSSSMLATMSRPV